MSNIRHILFFFIMSSIIPFNAHAGVYTNELSKCLIESTSQRDRVALVRWMFTAASRHPAVKSISSVSETQLDAANKTTGQLIMRLLTVSCKNETEKAFQFEGQSTLESSFMVLGQVAGKELFSSPEVSAAMAGLNKYIDKNKLNSIFN
ncbi:hypothetical protein [Thiomicrorhabdus sp. Milos-T2]|uniref:hypothetical protein n=1 Tax=Thiomicrorhabdus sp. Milos-T2 TaxID=90814 RepID=UPI00049432CA|nr:hypothetical protein [Thiomicrorhabdus sp. Milos-T2]